MALFLGAAAATGIDRGKDMAGSGIVVSAPDAISVPDVVTTAGSSDADITESLRGLGYIS